MDLTQGFSHFSKWVARAAGQPLTFGLALLVILAWIITGPIFSFSDTWQLVINTGTTIITFLMVFLIQSTQNRDGEAVQIKLDELIRAVKGARNDLIDIEDLTEEELDRLRSRYERLASLARNHGEKAPKLGEAAKLQAEAVDKLQEALEKKERKHPDAA